MNHSDIGNRITSWLESENWPYNQNEDNSQIYLSLESGKTGLCTNIQIHTFDDGYYRVYALWPYEIKQSLFYSIV